MLSRSPAGQIWTLIALEASLCEHTSFAPRSFAGSSSHVKRTSGPPHNILGIIIAASLSCGLLNQSHTSSNQLLVSFDSEVRKRGAEKWCELRNRDTRQ